MKKIILACCIIIGTIIATRYWCASTPSQKNDVLIVGTSPDFPPYVFLENNILKGFDVDLMNAIGNHINKEIQFNYATFNTLLLELQSERIDVIASGMTPTKERAKQVAFTQSYLHADPLVVITPAQKPITSLNDLKGAEIIVNDGYTAEKYMADKKEFDLKRLPSPAEAFMALTAGRADAYVSARNPVQPYFDRYGDAAFNVYVIPETNEETALAVAKNNSLLLNQLEDALSSLKKDGTIDTLKNKWQVR